MTPVVLRVRELREARGWSQRELARRAGVRQATLSAIENAQTTGIDFETLERLAKALDVDPAFLIAKQKK
jgi:transcriptional regulator with XRE-family HTH domain